MRSHLAVGTAPSRRKRMDIEAFEEVLACNIKDVIADFCLADAEIIRFYASNQLHGNMDEMLTSSAELYFKNETLSYGHVANVCATQDEAGCVVLDMEFMHDIVSVFFQIIFGDRYIGVKIQKVLLDPEFDKSKFNPSFFAKILTSARLRPLPPRFKSSYCLAESSWH